MRAVVYERHGGVEELVVRELPDPTPAAGEALIRIRAAALNGFDPMMLGGGTGLKTPLPMTPCGDGAGEVVAFGDGAADAGLEIGARVMIDPSIPGIGMFGETVPGTCCELLCVPLGNLLPMPDGVTFARAAAIPVAYGTALKMLEDRGDVREAERVVVLGATGGVGCCSVQLARRAGAEVIACGRGAWKLDRLREIGAHHVIDTAETDWVDAVWQLFGRPRYKQPGGGVDVVVNYIGGDTWAKSLKVLCDGGRMLTCGATAGYDPPTDIRYIWSFEQTIIGSDGWTRAGLAQLLEWTASGELEPVIHAERPLEETRESMRELIDREVFGKSIILP
ncbi:MAG: zinc-binding dehydrogenase [Gemmatimonadota bacterium]